MNNRNLFSDWLHFRQQLQANAEQDVAAKRPLCQLNQDEQAIRIALLMGEIEKTDKLTKKDANADYYNYRLGKSLVAVEQLKAEKLARAKRKKLIDELKSIAHKHL
jgi:uncharacterized small protein (DUF1192 family)